MRDKETQKINKNAKKISYDTNFIEFLFALAPNVTSNSELKPYQFNKNQQLSSQWLH